MYTELFRLPTMMLPSSVREGDASTSSFIVMGKRCMEEQHLSFFYWGACATIHAPACAMLTLMLHLHLTSSFAVSLSTP